MNWREYSADRDLQSVQRIWRECGWITDEKQADVLESLISAGEGLVATIDDEAECFAHSTPGLISYQNEDLNLGAVTAITTSHIARKLGFAGRLTAKLLSRQVASGQHVSALGMFDQGFYDKLGFGTGSYENWIRFDPVSLLVDRQFRPPKRLTVSDYKAIHGAMMARRNHHGNVRLLPPELLIAELTWTDKPFGLGYFDGPNGTLSHFIWGSMEREYGPYKITWCAWQTGDQLLELLALIKSLGDQVSSISIVEFAGIQFQDLLKTPFRQRRITRSGEHENTSRAAAHWQLRILDLEACMARTHLNTPPVKFNLELTDPVESYLDEGGNWRGIGGEYIVELGEESRASKGTEKNLPTLKANVNAFSRLWFGVRPASSLAITSDLSGDPELLKMLDESLRLPNPQFGWDF